MKRVVILQKYMVPYRVPFFRALRGKLRNEGVALQVVYGVDGDPVPFSTDGIAVRNVWLAGGRLLYQPVLPFVGDCDLVISEQANKILMNYYLMVSSALGRRKFAFWGHGRDRMMKAPVWSEWMKRKLVSCCDWWFAYTEETAEYLGRLGVRNEIITRVDNAVDTETFAAEVQAIPFRATLQLRESLGIPPDAPVGLFCGRFYREKRLDLLLDGAATIRKKIPDFHLVLLGGQTDELPEGAASEQVFAAGEMTGPEKALYFATATVFLHPGCIGLAILDAFAAGLPVVTTEVAGHGPEIEYLVPGTNGLLSSSDQDDFADAVVTILQDDILRARMKREARETAVRVSLDNMVENFAAGVLGCLGESQ